MEPGNDIDWAAIPTLLRNYIYPIACALFHLIYICIMPQQQSDDLLRQQEEGRIQQGCYPWDDEYSDEEDGKGESFTGINHESKDEKDGEQESVTIRECKGA